MCRLRGAPSVPCAAPSPHTALTCGFSYQPSYVGPSYRSGGRSRVTEETASIRRMTDAQRRGAEASR
jgi:hypothetical protein